MFIQHEEKARLKRERSKEAIALAMDSRWEEAVVANQSILEAVPTDVDALNRLGRALMELGRYVEAKAAYENSLELHPSNSIARKNLIRLEAVREMPEEVKGETGKVSPHFFVGEEGKVGLVPLTLLASEEVLARVAVADEVALVVRTPNLAVENFQGEYLGTVESRHGLRLAKLTLGGNRYTAAIASLNEGAVKVVIREAYRHPSQVGRPSFPARVVDALRPYLRGSIIKYERGEEGEWGEEDAEDFEGDERESGDEVLPEEDPVNPFEMPALDVGVEEEEE